MTVASADASEPNSDDNNVHEPDAGYYSFGVFPYLSTRDTAITYGPVNADFNQALSHEIRLRTSSSFEKFSEKLAEEYYDIALIQPFDYLPAVEQYNYEPLARVDEPLVTVFVVKNDSPFKNLDDLRGQRIAFPPKPAANSLLGLRALRKAGLIPGKDIYIDYMPSHGACMHQVIISAASACVTGPPIVKIFNERMNAQVHVLAETEAIPHILFVAHERVPLKDRIKLQQLITSWHTTEHGKNLLHHLGFPKFTKTKRSDYEIMRQYSSTTSELERSRAVTESQSKEQLVLGVFPYLPPKRLAQTMAPLPSAFSAVVNMPVTFRTTSSFAKFTENLENQAYDIALVQPFDYELALNNDYVPLVQKKGLIQAGFFVLEESGIKSLRDLKNTSVAMPPHGAAVSRLAIAELRKHGLIAGKDLEIQYRRSHDSCLFQLRRKLVSACAVWAEVTKLVSPEEMRGIKLLQTTDSIPSPLFVVKKSLPTPLREKLAKEMLSWHNTQAGKQLLQTIRIGPFEEFSAARYDAFLAKRQDYQ
ncbi:MAG: phosphate/phosphite/phosphonate ABC transporter substrate-binding protein [Gammaproteobacteria bacterium]